MVIMEREAVKILLCTRLRHSDPGIGVGGEVEQHLSRSILASGMLAHLALSVVVDVVGDLLAEPVDHGERQTTLVAHQADGGLFDDSGQDLEVLELELNCNGLESVQFWLYLYGLFQALIVSWNGSSPTPCWVVYVCYRVN